MTKMRILSICANILKNVRGKGNQGIGMIVNWSWFFDNYRIFYMALPPNVFTPVAEGLKRNVYPENGIARLIVRPHSVSEKVM